MQANAGCSVVVRILQRSSLRVWRKMSNDVKTFDYLVIGGGSGGVASARRATEFGVTCGIIEKDRLGGTCVHKSFIRIYKIFPILLVIR